MRQMKQTGSRTIRLTTLLCARVASQNSFQFTWQQDMIFWLLKKVTSNDLDKMSRTLRVTNECGLC